MAATTIGSLIINLQANIAQLQKGFDKATRDLNGAVGKMTAILKGFAGAASGYLSGRMFVDWLGGAIDAADELNKLSQKTGIAVEKLGGLRHAADLSDVPLETLGMALGKLAALADKAGRGSVEAGRAFRRVGVDVRDANGNLRPTEDLLGDLADRFAAMPDGPRKSAIAIELFGRAGTKLIPLLNLGREGLAEFQAEAERLGLVVSAKTAAAAEQFNDNLTRIKGSLTGVANAITGEILPVLERFSSSMANAGSRGILTNTAVVVVKGLAVGFLLLGREISRTAIALGTFLYLAKSVGQLDAVGARAAILSYRRQMAELNASFKASWDSLTGKGPTIETPEPPKPSGGGGGEDDDLAPGRKRTAEEIAASIRDAEIRTSQILAEETESRIDNIRAEFASRKAAIADRLANEKATAEERLAFQRELAAVEDAETRAVWEAQEEEWNATLKAERAKAQEQAEFYAGLTETQTDDIRAEFYKRRDELLEQKETEYLTEEEYQQRLDALREFYLAKGRDARKRENEEATRDAREQTRAVASYFANTFADMVIAPLSEGFKGLETILDMLKAMVLDLIKQLIVAGIVKAITGAATGGVGGALLGAIGLAEGGRVDGPGTETSDSVLARLSRGEYVINAKSARKFGLPFLDWINALGDRPLASPPVFASGGLVGATAGASYGGARAAPIVFNISALDPLTTAEVVADRIGPALRLRYTTRQLGMEGRALSAALARPRSR